MYNPMPPAKRSFPGITISLLILTVILAVLLGVAAHELIKTQQVEPVIDQALLSEVGDVQDEERRIVRDPFVPTPLLQRLAFLTKSGATNRCLPVSSLLTDKVLANGVATGSDAFDPRIAQYFDEYIPSIDRPVFEDAYAEALASEGVGVAYVCTDDDKVAFLFGSSLEQVSIFAWRDSQPWIMPAISGLTAPYYISAIDTGYELFVTGEPFALLPSWNAWRLEIDTFNKGQRVGYQLNAAESCTAREVDERIEYVCFLEHAFAQE
ncbi:hypothetical protein KBC55_02415 [Patescibacteria group bacterium]|nr:hypothetical protein [Patescibacteria group bacterium]